MSNLQSNIRDIYRIHDLQKNFDKIFLIFPLAKTVNMLEKNQYLLKVSSNIGQGIVKQNTQLENILFSTSYNIVQDHIPLKNIC